MVEMIEITYQNGAYYVNRPNWNGGEVVPVEDYTTLYDDQFETDRAALDEVLQSIQRYGIRVYLENRFPDESATVH